jgi:hypothetical protein
MTLLAETSTAATTVRHHHVLTRGHRSTPALVGGTTTAVPPRRADPHRHSDVTGLHPFPMLSHSARIIGRILSGEQQQNEAAAGGSWCRRWSRHRGSRHLSRRRKYGVQVCRLYITVCFTRPQT